MNVVKFKEWIGQLPNNFLGLNSKQIIYAIAKLEGMSGTQAAIKAGYPEKQAHVQAHRLEHTQRIKLFYEEARRFLEEEVEGIMGVDAVLKEASRMAKSGSSVSEKKAGLEILASYHAHMTEGVAA